MNINRKNNPHSIKSRLAKLYSQYYNRITKQARKHILGDVSITVLEGIDSFANKNPGSVADKMRTKMLEVISSHTSVVDEQAESYFKNYYEQAYDDVYPAIRAYILACHPVNDISESHSLSSIDLEMLRVIDTDANEDGVLDDFRKELIARLEECKTTDDVISYSQAFEVYGEIVVYLYLTQRGLLTERLSERPGKGTPDFKCKWHNGKHFFVEVKSFDVVGGEFRNREMMENALDAKVELEEQIIAGKRIALATNEIDPYRKSGKQDKYDPFSLIRVIETLRDKSLTAFKNKQFKDGPTFALVLADRLVLPGGRFALSPYYYDNYDEGAIVSGVMWHMAYGRPGTPIFRHPDFPGAPSLEGHLDEFGIFVDKERLFPSPGLIILHREQSSHVGYGLANPLYPGGENWTVDDTTGVLNVVCDYQNDEDNSWFHELSVFPHSS